MSEMTDYQKAVADHMATAPEELREYVCERLRESNNWKDKLGKGRAWVLGKCPIHSCGFTWGVSPEKNPFWGCIARKEWKDAMATYFWKNRQANEQEAKMTAYQKSVQAHMETAPEELKRYVCKRLRESDRWTKGYHPISICGFNWNESEEEFDFWAQISMKQWKSAMATEFWKNRQANEQEVELTCTSSKERPKGVVGQWYTLTTKFIGCNETPNREIGYTWQCKELDSKGEPMIDGLWISRNEGYRLATPEEIAKAKKQPSYSDLIAAEYDRLKEKQLAKNKDYGDSLFQNKTILGVEINKRIGILSRIGDKIARLESQGEYMVEEGREETIDDLIGYLIAFQIVSRE